MEKNWQGVVFVLMDMLRDAGIEYAQTIEVAGPCKFVNC